MAERLTTVGRSLLASHQGNGTHLQVDKFVLAYIPGQNPSTEIDPARGLPPANQIVHEQAVTKSSYMSPDMVNYSLYMDDTVGPFTFNTIYTVATAESNAVIQIITVPDTPKIATDAGNNVRGQSMVRNAVLVYDDAAAITNITVEAAAWQFTYEKATTEMYGLTKEATKEQTLAGLVKGLFVSPFGLEAWWTIRKKEVTPYVGQLVIFTTPTLPANFPGFVLDNSTIPNGTNDYPELASSGCRWITISGNDIILHDASDVIRGQGTSERQVGDFQGDAIRNITGEFGNKPVEGNTSNFLDTKNKGAFKSLGTSLDNATIRWTGVVSGKGTNSLQFDASLVVPTASENRMKSKTALFAIYHGRIA